MYIPRALVQQICDELVTIVNSITIEEDKKSLTSIDLILLNYLHKHDKLTANCIKYKKGSFCDKFVNNSNDCLTDCEFLK